jgi:hypothetical protein
VTTKPTGLGSRVGADFKSNIANPAQNQKSAASAGVAEALTVYCSCNNSVGLGAWTMATSASSCGHKPGGRTSQGTFALPTGTNWRLKSLDNVGRKGQFAAVHRRRHQTPHHRYRTVAIALRPTCSKCSISDNSAFSRRLTSQALNKGKFAETPLVSLKQVDLRRSDNGNPIADHDSVALKLLIENPLHACVVTGGGVEALSMAPLQRVT